MTRTALTLKRVIDTVIAAIGLIVLAPLLIYVAIRIRLDSSGPALFRQHRAGRDGATFEVLKFRTMVVAADEHRDELRNADPDAGMLKLRDDPRVTKFGKKLRRSSLDELPQLWNVLRGDMSLVGPRPLPLDEAPLAQGHFADRHRVRPGMTGPWQIHGRSDIPFEDMVKLDYTYVSSWSLQEDLRLLVQTASVVLSGRGAY
jgi:lipopolysaccharide/colanic/teichoic acid biosynthesis glycosyltransferase